MPWAAATAWTQPQLPAGARRARPKKKFNAWFRVGLLGEDSEGQHYGVDIGQEDKDGNFSRAVRVEQGRLEFGGFIIRETDGELTIE